MEAGKIYDNKSNPFFVMLGDFTENIQFELKVEISTDNVYNFNQNIPFARSSNGHRVFLQAVPKK